MMLEQLAYAAQVVGTIGVIVSLVFVGFQIRQNTAALVRSEHNSTMSEWSGIRMAIAQNRDLSELMTAGLHESRTLDPADRLRLEQMMSEYAWASFHIWDRTQRGVFPQGTFEETAAPLLAPILTAPAGSVWWRTAKTVEFFSAFVADVDAFLAAQQSPEAPPGLSHPRVELGEAVPKRATGERRRAQD